MLGEEEMVNNARQRGPTMPDMEGKPCHDGRANNARTGGPKCHGARVNHARTGGPTMPDREVKQCQKQWTNNARDGCAPLPGQEGQYCQYCQ
ncbi:hypothetical protein DPMN_083922 [Dreissena polymorpha]|uniref:Uncharacterized protein n=1 Tax=Dreissena polymorpha TaxID=45954 RepID=A0A9D4BIS2_DREPO|nr:hypothetical protein DPMN_083922 [Dreissena polymorpha]